MPKHLQETGRLLEADKATPTRRNIQIITPGWGSSGYYSAEVLQEAATNRVIPAGTHMYLNHASESERTDRPERDVEKIAAVLVEDATWDGQRLTAPADLIGPHAELIEALAPYIGVSISGSATDITIGEAEGRTGPIIEGLAQVDSVDFVTHAGRGGMVLLEAARPSLVNARAVHHGVAEATANDTREGLQQLLRDAYAGERTYVWVRDFDESTVWFEIESGDASGIYEQTYTSDDTGAVGLTGDRTEVRVVTKYVPVTRPGSTTTTTEASKEDTMPQIEEARLRELEEAHGRVPTLETERDTANRRAETAEAELARRDRVDQAATIIAEQAKTGAVSFTALECRGLLADLPIKEGQLDVDAFTKTVSEAVADKKASTVQEAAGGVRGFGTTTQQNGGKGLSESDFNTRLGIQVKGA